MFYNLNENQKKFLIESLYESTRFAEPKPENEDEIRDLCYKLGIIEGQDDYVVSDLGMAYEKGPPSPPPIRKINPKTYNQ